MSIKDRMYEDMKIAMKAGQKVRLETVRMAIALLKKEAIDSGKELDEAGEVALVQRSIKQRRESVETYEKAGRPELAAKEREEIEVLTAYLPQQLSDAELDQGIAELVRETGASSPKDLGKVMPALMKKFAGRVDGNRARAALTRALGG